MSTVAHVDHMELSERIADRLSRGELTATQVDEFRDFLDQVDRDVFRHRVVTSNPYTRWFQQGEATDDELRHFLRQFSVFSNQFLVAAPGASHQCARRWPRAARPRRSCSTNWASSTTSPARRPPTATASRTRTARGTPNW